MTYRKTFFLGFSFIAVIAIGGFAKAEKKKVVTSVILQSNWIPTSQHAAFAYGIKKGFYADEGIELKMLNGKGSPFAIKTVVITNFSCTPRPLQKGRG